MSKLTKNVWKHVLQVGVLLLIIGFVLTGVFTGRKTDVEAYCPFGGIQSLVTYLNSNSLACSMSMVQIMIGIVLAIGVILFSKLFCGYLCPLGTITEWMGRLRDKMHIRLEIPMGSVADKLLRFIKYALLFWVFYMTISSSELFCKNLDPYYAMATGFKGEITAWMTVISITLLFLGSLLVKMFWCKYICPLGALSNIFRFTITFVILLVASLVLGRYFHLSMQWVWLLGASCVISYLYEIIYYRSKVFPLLHVTRDENACNACGLCNKACPHRIDVASVPVVKHIDCTLCGECIGSCNRDALRINRRKGLRWAPAIIVVALFGVALWLGNHYELPTINERWGDESKWENLASFEKGGMSTVKCFGSSKAFSARMKSVPGVYGVATYVSRFTVVVYYDPSETTPEKIEESMFTPAKRKLTQPPAGVDTLKIITLRVDQLFDRTDIVNLGNIIRQTEGYYGLVSEYDCPVKIMLYMDIRKEIDPKELKRLVEVKEFEMPAHGGTTRTVKCNYKLESISPTVDTIGRQEFLEFMFPTTTSRYEKNLPTEGEPVTEAVYEVPYPSLDKPLVQRQLPYLSSFLSTNKSILGYSTALRGEVPVIRISYIAGSMTDAEIWAFLNSETWTIHYKDGSIKEEGPKLQFKTEGGTVL